jgi:hypothetical protein
MPADHEARPLGRTGIDVLPLGIGTNKWRRADREAVLETYRTIHDAGPCMIDTAEIYFSERVVGDCLRAGPARAVIASKFLPFPGRTSPRRLMSALDRSLARLGLPTGHSDILQAKASAHIEIEERLLPSQGESHTFESCQVRKCADEATSFLLSSSLVGDSSNRSRYIAKLDALFSYWWAT